MATASLPVSRALRPPRRIDARALVGIFLMLAAVGASIAFWTASADTQALVVATRDLPAGATLTAADLTLTHARVAPAIAQAAISEEGLGGLIGQQLAEPVHAQQILVRSQISSHPRLNPDQMVVAVAVKPETALGGHVRPGDAVQVIVTLNKGKPDEHTQVALPRVTVYDVGYAQAVSAITTGSSETAAGRGEIQWISLAVTQDQALQLSQAKWAGELDIALLPPAASQAQP